MSDDTPTTGVGTRQCLHPSNTRATCDTCGHDIYFRDVTPLTVPHHLCLECFVDLIKRDPHVRLHLGAENIAYLSGGLTLPDDADPS